MTVEIAGVNICVIAAEGAVPDLQGAEVINSPTFATAFELAPISVIAADSTVNNRQCPKVCYATPMPIGALVVYKPAVLPLIVLLVIVIVP